MKEYEPPLYERGIFGGLPKDLRGVSECIDYDGHHRETKIGKALQYKSRIQRNLLTKWNLPWQGANIMRDVTDALINNEFDIKNYIECLLFHYNLPHKVFISVN